MQNKKQDLLLVFLGGTLGTFLRFLTGFIVPYVGNFPLHTFLVNIVGSFVIGFIAFSFHKKGARLFVGAGVLGGFTTYSAFAIEVATLGAANFWMPYVYAFVTIISGVLAALVGMRFSGRANKFKGAH